MFVVKCGKCGCIYTLTRDGLKRDSRNCPNCNAAHLLNDSDLIRVMSNNAMEIYRFPDDAVVTLTLNPKDPSQGFLRADVR